MVFSSHVEADIQVSGCRVEIIKEADEEDFEGEEGDEEVYRNRLGKNWCSPVNELMRGGVSWIASNVYVIYRGLQSLETYLSSRACMKFGIQQSMQPMLDENTVVIIFICACKSESRY